MEREEGEQKAKELGVRGWGGVWAPEKGRSNKEQLSYRGASGCSLGGEQAGGDIQPESISTNGRSSLIHSFMTQLKASLTSCHTEKQVC